MCRPVTCKKCQKTTWAGCGQHIAQVKARVPKDQWCGGHAKEAAPAGGSSEGGFWSRFRRSS